MAASVPVADFPDSRADRRALWQSLQPFLILFTPALLVTSSVGKFTLLYAEVLDWRFASWEELSLLGASIHEIILAHALLWRPSSRFLRCVALLTFASFLLYSILQAYRGGESCPCFGQVDVHPVASALLDGSAIAALWFVGRSALPSAYAQARLVSHQNA